MVEIIEEIKSDLSQMKDNSIVNDYISVPQFYSGRSIFITGGTGFLGKVLIEKLLRSFPDIKNIYILIRAKRGNDIEARMNDFFNTPVFDRLHQENPDNLKKIIPINGDVALDKLGICESDEDLLCRTVSVVFHSAATVKLEDTLKNTVAINVHGTKRVVQLCKKMKFLDALVHVSTAFCHTDSTEIDEIAYASPIDANEIISLTEWLPEDILDKVTPFLIGKKPNTYTFCKALAEDIINNEASNLPAIIVRPSIVLSAAYEPLPGWLDNPYGPTGALILMSLGLVKVYFGDVTKTLEMIPVDIVTNILLVSAWRTAVIKQKNLMVYNIVSGNRHRRTWAYAKSFFLKYMIKYPYEKIIWYPIMIEVKDPIVYEVISFFLEKIPVYILNFFVRMATGKNSIRKIYKKYKDSVYMVQYFVRNEWKYKDDNVVKLINSLSSDDKEIFNCDVVAVPEDNYGKAYCLGLRRYMLKQKDDTLSKSRQRLQIFYWIHIITIAALSLGLCYILWKFISLF